MTCPPIGAISILLDPALRFLGAERFCLLTRLFPSRAGRSRRGIEQFQHGTLVFQLCRPVWQRWLRDAALAGALGLPGFAQNPAPYLAVNWIPLGRPKKKPSAVQAGQRARPAKRGRSARARREPRMRAYERPRSKAWNAHRNADRSIHHSVENRARRRRFSAPSCKHPYCSPRTRRERPVRKDLGPQGGQSGDPVYPHPFGA
jgi:hypothetical protein